VASRFRGMTLRGRARVLLLVSFVMVAAVTVMPTSTSAEPAVGGPLLPPAVPTHVQPGPTEVPGGDPGLSRPQYIGSPEFAPGIVYTANFPDPDVLWDPGTRRYWAFGTETGAVNVPAMWSTDLKTWTTAADHGIPNSGGRLNDALPNLQRHPPGAPGPSSSAAVKSSSSSDRPTSNGGDTPNVGVNGLRAMTTDLAGLPLDFVRSVRGRSIS